jgi:transketolase
MRGDFFDKLHEEMKKNEKIFFLMGDTGYNLVEPLFEEFPDRTLNVGVAEQNMIGIAAGLCNLGYEPICYGISNFLIHRCLEQIRNDLCMHDYPVTLVGTSTGLDNGALWATHYVVDDIACVKPFPNMHIYSPSSVESIHKIFDEVINLSHPAYVRITKKSFNENKEIKEINHFVVENNNSDILIISHGRMTSNSFDVSKLSNKISVFAMDKIKPIEKNIIKSLTEKFKRIIVIEDNFNSGLFNSITQSIAEMHIHDVDIFSISPEEDYGDNVGSTDYLDNMYGLTPEKINEFIKKNIDFKKLI